MALGQHGAPRNIWDGLSADTDEASSDGFDMGYGNEAHIFGSAEGSYLVRVQYSQDGTNWYNGENVEPDDDDHFNLKLSGIQARFIRVQALRGPDLSTFEDDQKSDPMKLTATLVAKTTR